MLLFSYAQQVTLPFCLSDFLVVLFVTNIMFLCLSFFVDKGNTVSRGYKVMGWFGGRNIRLTKCDREVMGSTPTYRSHSTPTNRAH